MRDNTLQLVYVFVAIAYDLMISPLGTAHPFFFSPRRRVVTRRLSDIIPDKDTYRTNRVYQELLVLSLHARFPYHLDTTILHGHRHFY